MRRVLLGIWLLLSATVDIAAMAILPWAAVFWLGGSWFRSLPDWGFVLALLVFLVGLPTLGGVFVFQLKNQERLDRFERELGLSRIVHRFRVWDAWVGIALNVLSRSPSSTGRSD